MTTLQELAFNEAVRAIESQRRQLENLRTRAVTLLSVSAIVGSLFSLGAKHLRWWQVLPAAGVAVVAVLVLFPVSFVFSNDVMPLISEIDEHPEPDQLRLASVQRDWAWYMASDYERNAKTIRRLPGLLRAACVLLIVQFAVGVLALR